MTLKECIIKTHDAIVDKAKKNIDAGASAQTIADIGTDVIEYGKTWTEAVGNDGKIDDAEMEKIKTTFNDKIDKRVPDVSGIGVTVIWDGISILGIGWKGVRYYLNKWLDLDIKE